MSNLTWRTLMVVAVFALAALPVLAEQNIVKNGSMESGGGPLSEDPHVPAGWTRFGPTVERSDEANLAPAGAGHALKAFSSDPQVGAYQDVGPVTPGQQVQVSASLYTRSNDRLTGDAEARINLEFYNAANQQTGFHFQIVLNAASPANTWVPGSIGPVAAPANTTYARMTCVWTWNGSATGSAFWDDCRLTINGGANQLVNGDVETAGVGENSPTGIDDWLGFNDQQKSQDFAYHGTSSLRVGMGDPFSGLYQSMDTLSEGDRILLFARVYQEVGTNGLVATDRAGIKLEFFPPGGGSLPPPTENLAVNSSTAQNQWNLVELTASGITVPEGATIARVSMILFAPSEDGTGSVFFDSAFAGTPSGANRLMNASFETGAGGGISNWTAFTSSGTTAAKSTAITPHNGSFTLRTSITPAATAPVAVGMRQDVTVTEGETINVSAFLQNASFDALLGTAVAGVKVEWIAGSIPTNVDITVGPSDNTITAASPREQWLDLFIDYTMPAGTEAGVRFVALVARSGGGANGAAHFDACEAVVYTHFDGADVDNNDDEDLRDFAIFQDTFSGSGVPATEWNAIVFDHDEDGDVDLTDYNYFQPRLTGPQ